MAEGSGKSFECVECGYQTRFFDDVEEPPCPECRNDRMLPQQAAEAVRRDREERSGEILQTILKGLSASDGYSTSEALSGVRDADGFLAESAKSSISLEDLREATEEVRGSHFGPHGGEYRVTSNLDVEYSGGVEEFRVSEEELEKKVRLDPFEGHTFVTEGDDENTE